MTTMSSEVRCRVKDGRLARIIGEAGENKYIDFALVCMGNDDPDDHEPRGTLIKYVTDAPEDADLRAAWKREQQRRPECGDEFCEECGDCLHCYGEDECCNVDPPTHTWPIRSLDGDYLFRDGELIPQE